MEFPADVCSADKEGWKSHVKDTGLYAHGSSRISNQEFLVGVWKALCVCLGMVLSSQTTLERGLSGFQCTLFLYHVECFSLKLNALFLSNSSLRIYFLILGRVVT